jgi:hypothetical protein
VSIEEELNDFGITYYSLLGQAPLDANGFASVAISNLSAGSHWIVATYSGDQLFAGNTSDGLTQTVLANNTTATLTASPNPSFYSQGVTFTVAVAPSGTPFTGPPTGTVTFEEQGIDEFYFPYTITLGQAALNSSGIASWTTTSLLEGSHTITARYGGDATFAGTESNSVTQTVVETSQLTPTISWALPAAITYGTPLGAQLNASATIVINGGTVTVPGTFTYTPAAGTILPVGSDQTLSVLFTPTDSLHYTASEASTTITVNPAPLTVTANDLSKAYGQDNPILTVHYVGFVNGETLATSGVSGTPELTTSALTRSPVDTYTITAALGSLTAGNYTFSLANGTLTVNPAPLTLAGIYATSKMYDGDTSVVLDLDDAFLEGVLSGDKV